MSFLSSLQQILSPVLTGADIPAAYGHDEALGLTPAMPDYLVRPETTEEVSAIMKLAQDAGVAVTVRGGGTGLSGGCVARQGGLLLSTERMKRIIAIDDANDVAVVQPGVTLGELDAALAPYGLIYPISPGELTATLGGNAATNAGGMRAVKYGVTRNQVLGLQAVLPGGDVIQSGGRFVKASSGLDLGQLLMGSEGSLAVITELSLRLVPRLKNKATLLLPFDSIRAVTEAVPKILRSGIQPLMMEYIDQMTMTAIVNTQNLQLGIPEEVQDSAMAFLVVMLEAQSTSRLDEDIESLGHLGPELGAINVYSLQLSAGSALLDAREKAFWVAKQVGANDIIDVVVPRAAMPNYMDEVLKVALAHGSMVVGCGHAGDGNVHLSVFQSDPEVKKQTLKALFEAGLALGGAISAEHGIGSVKRDYFLELEDPAKLLLMRKLKAAFDPKGIMNPKVSYSD